MISHLSLMDESNDFMVLPHLQHKQATSQSRAVEAEGAKSEQHGLCSPNSVLITTQYVLQCKEIPEKNENIMQELFQVCFHRINPRNSKSKQICTLESIAFLVCWKLIWPFTTFACFSVSEFCKKLPTVSPQQWESIQRDVNEMKMH